MRAFKVTEMSYKLNTKKPHLLCLILLISFPSAVTVLISPALPAIGEYFHITSGYTQQFMTIFIIGYAIGQLLYPPFANRFGRKIAIYLGVGLYIVSSIVCLLGIATHSLMLTLIGRLFMALGSSVGMVISFTIINDFYHPEQARSVVSYTVLSYAFMPALAIALGGFITTHLSWISCFYFYLFYGIFILLISTRLPETLETKNALALKIKPLLQSYKQAFTTKRLLIFSAIYGLMATYIYITASAAPFIGINTIGLSAQTYGLLLLLPYCGQLIGSLTAGRLTQFLSGYQMMQLGYGSIILGSILMLICFLCHWVNTVSLFVPLFFVMMGLPMTYSTVTVMALVDYPDKATGSAIMSFITMSITLAATFLLTLLPSKYPLVMPLLFIATSILACIGFGYVRTRFSDAV